MSGLKDLAASRGIISFSLAMYHQSNDELEEVIPNIVDIGCDFLSQFSAFLGIIGLEEL